MMDNTADLRVLLASPTPLVLAETHEEERFLGVIRDLAADLDLAVWTWSSTSGLARDGGPGMHRTENPHQALAWIEDVTAPAVFVFADAHPILADSYVVRRIKETAGRLHPGQTIVMTAPSVEVPPELTSDAHLWKLRPPESPELMALIHRTVEDLSTRGFPVSIDETSLPDLSAALRGLSISQAERVIQAAAMSDGALSAADLPAIRSAKAELFTAEGILELIEADVGTLDGVGGLENLKQWLEVRTRAQQPDARHLGLPAPRGILLTGVPGCGKSYVAKTLARTWGQPLILLDPGRLFSKYIGESEERLNRALSAVDAMAPAVLWIDE
ncbi:MAG: AAA family ATPase, partial [Acidimicrobiia bacterium]|nr:AAA family ATPase [Acidimicrobiia bacterium]